MRFLADKNISYRLCALLENVGHQAAHVDQFSLGAAEDAAILDFARSDEWVVISSDTDFGTLLAAQRATTPSVILTREVSRLRADELARLLISLRRSAQDRCRGGDKPARDTGPAASVAIAAPAGMPAPGEE